MDPYFPAYNGGGNRGRGNGRVGRGNNGRNNVAQSRGPRDVGGASGRGLRTNTGGPGLNSVWRCLCGATNFPQSTECYECRTARQVGSGGEGVAGGNRRGGPPQQSQLPLAARPRFMLPNEISHPQVPQLSNLLENINMQDNETTSSSATAPKRSRKHKIDDGMQRKGPVFGYNRLNGFLSETTDAVIMSISLNIQEWSEFLKNSYLSPELFHLVVQTLGEKVCSEETIQKQAQIEILLATNTSNFVDKLNAQCSNIMLGVGNVQKQRRNGPHRQAVVDESPEIFLECLYKYCSFALRIIPQVVIDYLRPTITHAFGAITVKEIGGAAVFTILKAKFQQLLTEIQLAVKKLEEKNASKELLRGGHRNGFSAEDEAELDKMEAPEDFREISIVPCVRELLSREHVFLRPNKKSGAYQDANHYLDVQFRLLREDFVQPLKKGIQDFMKNRFDYLSRKKKIPLGTIRIYPDVQIVNSELSRDIFVYKIQLLEDSYKRIKWDKSKRLLTGSLLVFTSDNFQSAHFAVVASRNVDELSKGILSVVWEGQPPVWDKDDEYLMVECEVYFEAYRYTLQILKQLDLQSFPMYKFIVEASADVNPPNYLLHAEHFMKIQLTDGECTFFSPLDLNQWPSKEELGLDLNQFTAFQAAMTKEFAIIQGPPGTGKTFLGLKIAELLLMNEQLWASSEAGVGKGPILVVCYTNHALDQFLEGILNIFKKQHVADPEIVRVGGRSKSEVLNTFSLQNVVRRKGRTMPKHFWPNQNEIRDRIDELRNMRASVMEAVKGLRDIQGIVDFTKLEIWNELQSEYPPGFWKCITSESWLNLEEAKFTGGVHFDQEALIRRYFDIRDFSRGKARKIVPLSKKHVENSSENSDEEDYDVEEILRERVLEEIFTEADLKISLDVGRNLRYVGELSLKDADSAIRRLQNSVKKIQESQNNAAAWQNAGMGGIQQKIITTENRKRYLEKIFEHYKNDVIDLPDVSAFLESYKRMPSDIVEKEMRGITKVSARWAMYFAIVERARELSAEKVSEIEKLLITEQTKFRQSQAFADGWVLRNSLVVGMTTTGAAKYNELVKMMRSKIVIVEEAAEVLEAHIVTCITKRCEHMILIGDHRQLRPSTTVYNLATKFNLDISLFERMINNKLNCYQLKAQHRMRPEIADLVKGTIYTELDNNPNVYNYPPVLGMTKNLFFLTHTMMEKSETDSMSKTNPFEAQFLAALTRHLCLQGYQSSQITVITTYTGQMFLLKKEIGKFPNCRGVRVTCVDNFQGEENDIILLSLVRSNVDCKIGFLNIDNRVCVSLSRAKHGMFIVGNLSLLSEKSKTWAQIQEKLEARGEVGRSLTLECSIHSTRSNISTSEDFKTYAPDGGCNQLCEAALSCSHNCIQVCHLTDTEHKNYKCLQPCSKSCETSSAAPHPCQFPCFRKCPACPVLVNKKLLCGHQKVMHCHKNPDEVVCEILVLRTLPCTHEENLACHIDINQFVCKVPMERQMNCGLDGHKKVLPCHVDVAATLCRVLVEKELPCGHKEMAECRSLPEMIKCSTMVQKKVENCNHMMAVRCSEKGKSVTCRNPCDVRLTCGHACTKFCHIAEDPEHLNYICRKDCARVCPEGHKCSRKHKCNTACSPCGVEVSRKLLCGHDGKMPCFVEIEKYECLLACEKLLDCHHSCDNLCFQNCGPCKQIVRKRIRECGHPINIECGTRPTQDHCMELVKPLQLSLCSHHTTVPCRISRTANPTEIMAHCSQPCRFSFSEVEGGCDHLCKGTCGDCQQGRFHVKCQEKCGKQLVCGHVCDFDCTLACPPCDKMCLMKCEHSECKKKCGEPCLDCSEPCPWKCPHKACQKLCREPCDREPCDDPCNKKLPCGHPCIGFCGEPCPVQCRICDKQELTVDFFLLGNEEEEDSRFVYLPDCKHAIEVEGLKYYMNLKNDEIGLKCCPRCKTVIRYCRRFSTIIRNQLRDVILVKAKIFGNQKQIQLTQSAAIKVLNNDREQRWGGTMKPIHDYFVKHLMNVVPASSSTGIQQILPKKVDNWTMSSLQAILNYAEDLAKLLLQARKELRQELTTDLGVKCRELFAKVMARKLPLSAPEIRDIGREVERIYDLNQVYRVRSAKQFTDGHSRALPIYQQILNLVLSHSPYTGGSKPLVRRLLKDLEDVLRTGLGITDMERRSILAAIGMKQGHWYKCPNGHVYVIGECGGPNQRAVCNECGAAIGGGSTVHRSIEMFQAVGSSRN